MPQRSENYQFTSFHTSYLFFVHLVDTLSRQVVLADECTSMLHGSMVLEGIKVSRNFRTFFVAHDVYLKF
jgi:hypothetical protein